MKEDSECYGPDVRMVKPSMKTPLHCDGQLLYRQREAEMYSTLTIQNRYQSGYIPFYPDWNDRGA
jgi:hypothetical protein